MTGRGRLYITLIGLLLSGGLGVLAWLLVALESAPGRLGAQGTLTVLLGSTLGLAFLLVFPAMGLISRHDPEMFEQLTVPRDMNNRPVPRRAPPLQIHTLWQYAGGWLVLGLLADGVTWFRSLAELRTWTPPGLLSLLGLYLALTLLAGGRLYLGLRGPARSSVPRL